MGRKDYLEILRKSASVYTAAGLAFVALGLLLFLIGSIGSISPGLLVSGVVLVLIGIIFLIVAGQCRNGENSKYVKKRGNVLELADDLQTPVYQDNSIIVSEKAIAPKKDILRLMARDDVVGVYEHIVKNNFITVNHQIIVKLRNGKTVNLNVYAKKKEVVENLLLTFDHFCPNAIVGYTDEMRRHVKEECKAYKQKMKELKQ